MAICFELVVNFGDNAEAAQAAARINPKPWVLRAGAHRIPLHRPLVAKADSYIELSILPMAVSWGCGLDGSLPRFQLTAAELTELGHQLYALVAQFGGYVAAKVGWNPESLLDPAELRCEWSDELNAGSIHGLVLSEELYAELDLSADYEVFRPGYRWMPYRGEESSALTAD
ncbi:hypothetical protein [Streptomyces sp. NRRL WC-3725]|uniref:hypothetical protein n=1 Tax=Streptomyces sp. NRRL WC-3725 TaxID=1463933 RepID=UPI0004C7F16C|nr:hypothetical protein [Streptomyces sp. NRRL WC-3725]